MFRNTETESVAIPVCGDMSISMVMSFLATRIIATK